MNVLDLKECYYALLVGIIKGWHPEKAFKAIEQRMPISKRGEVHTPSTNEERKQAQEMAQLREDGVKFKDIAKKYGLTVAVVQGKINKEKRMMEYHD